MAINESDPLTRGVLTRETMESDPICAISICAICDLMESDPICDLERESIRAWSSCHSVKPQVPILRRLFRDVVSLTE